VEIQPKKPSTKGLAQMFTGDVWFDVIAQGQAPSRLRVNLVRFAPGARTAWHRHAPTVRRCTSPTVWGGSSPAVARSSSCAQDRRSTPRPGSGTGTAPPPGTSCATWACWRAWVKGQDGPETEWGEHVTDQDYGTR